MLTYFYSKFSSRFETDNDGIITENKYGGWIQQGTDHICDFMAREGGYNDL